MNSNVEYPTVKKNENVLDLFCGIGSIGLYLSNKVKEIRGIDISKENIQNAINVIEQACAVITAQYKTELDETPNVQGVTELADSSVVIRTTFTAWNWQQLVIERALRQVNKVAQIFVQ